MQHRGETLSPTEAAEIRALVERVGEQTARRALRISGQTLARAIGQMHVQRATATHIRAMLSELQREAA